MAVSRPIGPAAAIRWSDRGLVFASEFGTPVDPRNILRTMQLATYKAGMSEIGVQRLHHNAAVAWLESDVNRVMHYSAVRVGFQNLGSPVGRMQTCDPAWRRLVYPGWPLPAPVIRGAGAE
jgi:hypothetical protein